MLRRLFLVLMLFGMVLAPPALAAAPQTINFQGRLTDSVGDPIATPVDVVFTIYYVGGASVWTETWNSGTSQITPDENGVFSILLGIHTPLAIDFSDSYEIGVAVGGDPEMTPKQKMVTVPYAFYAITAESIAGGGSYVLTTGDTMTGQLIISNEAIGLKLIGSAEIGDFNCSATGQNSVAMGQRSTASGDFSFAAGASAVAAGLDSVAFGSTTSAGGPLSFVFGAYNVADGAGSMALGCRAQALHDGAFVWADYVPADPAFPSTSQHQFLIRARNGVGIGTNETSSQLTVFGTIETTGNGGIMFPDGTIQITKATGGGSSPWTETGETVSYVGSMEIGDSDVSATGQNSVAMVKKAVASGKYTMATGYDSRATAVGAMATGYRAWAFGDYSNAMGVSTTANGNSSTVMGYQSSAGGDYSTSMGDQTHAIGDRSTAMGSQTSAVGNYSTAIGQQTSAEGAASTALGNNTTAKGSHSTSMGYGTTAQGYGSLAGGYESRATASDSMAYGRYTHAASSYSTALGYLTTAEGASSFAVGDRNRAGGSTSAAMGFHAIAGHNGTFVWSDSSATDFASTGQDQFLIEADGGVGIGTFEPQAELHVEGGIIATGVITGDGSGLSNLPSSPSGGGWTDDGTTVRLTTVTDNVGIGTTEPISKISVVGINADSKPVTAEVVYASYVGGEISRGGWFENTRGETTKAELAFNNDSVDVAGIFSDGQREVYLAYNAPGGDFAALFADGDVKIDGGNLIVIGSAEIGGSGSSATGQNSIAMGHSANASGDRSFAVGYLASATSSDAIAFGWASEASAPGAVAMGESTTAQGDRSFTAGYQSKVTGGSGANGSAAIGENVEVSGRASIAMGFYTTATDFYSTALGYNTLAGGTGAMAAGYRAKAAHNGTFVWADNTAADFSSTGDKQFLIRATGGVGIGTSEPQAELHVAGDITFEGIIYGNGSGLTNLPSSPTGGGWTDDGANVRLTTITDKVGIGTASTNVALKVVGSAEIGALNVSATGFNSVAMGKGTTARGYVSTAMGQNTSAEGTASTAMGDGSTASGSHSTAIGDHALASGQNATAIGYYATAGGEDSVAMGLGAKVLGGAGGLAAIAMGNNAQASGHAAVAMGYYTNADADYSTAIGTSIEVDGNYSVGVGLDTAPRTVTQANTMAIMGGFVGIATTEPSVTLEVNGDVRITGTLYGGSPLDIAGGINMVGGDIEFPDGSMQTTAATPGAFSGNFVEKTGDTMTGDLTIDPGNLKVVGSAEIGASDNSATGKNSVAMGSGNTASGNYSLATGYNTTAIGDRSVAAGNRAQAIGYDSISFGLQTTAEGDQSIAVGDGAVVGSSGHAAVSMGWQTTASQHAAVAMGDNTQALGTQSVAMGGQTTTEASH
ncbi:hypothetical protein ACFLZ2_03965, partial [Candidatus Margulisiibacteriota bacterium]